MLEFMYTQLLFCWFVVKLIITNLEFVYFFKKLFGYPNKYYRAQKGAPVKITETPFHLIAFVHASLYI